jgi:tryptophanyl-tRNA synthetase
MDTDSQEFKNYVKLKNLTTKTAYEQHMEDRENFKKIMPMMAGLTKQEKHDLMHQIHNNGDQKWNKLEEMVSKKLEKQLAKIQEEQAYLAKNRYRLDKEIMEFAEPTRMPVDKKKL